MSKRDYEWKIDGVKWTFPCTVERTAEITASDISGLLLDKTYFNDVLATYLKYDIRIEVPFNRIDEYTELYDEYLIAPVSAHEFVLPYVGGMITVVGRIENIKDIYVRTKDGGIHWRGIQFSLIGNHPTKDVIYNGGSRNEQYKDIDGTIVTFGIPDFPSQSDVSVGDAYIYTYNGWEVLPDAEDSEY